MKAATAASVNACVSARVKRWQTGWTMISFAVAVLFSPIFFVPTGQSLAASVGGRATTPATMIAIVRPRRVLIVRSSRRELP